MSLCNAAAFLDSPLAADFRGVCVKVATRYRLSRPHQVEHWNGLLEDVMKFKDQHDWGVQKHQLRTLYPESVADEGMIAGLFLTSVLSPVDQVIQDSGADVHWTFPSAHTKTWPELDVAGYMTGPPMPHFGWGCAHLVWSSLKRSRPCLATCCS